MYASGGAEIIKACKTDSEGKVRDLSSYSCHLTLSFRFKLNKFCEGNSMLSTFSIHQKSCTRKNQQKWIHNERLLPACGTGWIRRKMRQIFSNKPGAIFGYSQKSYALVNFSAFHWFSFISFTLNWIKISVNVLFLPINTGIYDSLVRIASLRARDFAYLCMCAKRFSICCYYTKSIRLWINGAREIEYTLNFPSFPRTNLGSEEICSFVLCWLDWNLVNFFLSILHAGGRG